MSDPTKLARATANPSDPPGPPRNQVTKNRAMLIGLFAVFLLPIITAIVLQSQWVDWQPPAVKQSGTLLQPVVELPPVVSHQLSAGDGQWTLVQIEHNSCQSACQERIDLIHHLQQLLGREQDKLHRVLSVSGGFDDGAGLLQVIDDPTVHGWFAQQLQSGGLLLVDPLGNAMMRYPADFDPVGLRADLARLLKKSKFLEQSE